MIRFALPGCLIVASIAVTLAGTAERKAVAGEWPQWRGPNRDGISTETGLLASWNGAPPLVWRATGLGSGFSSVAISGGRIYSSGSLANS
jgi:outer membrane protein assembly factor BamB